MPLKNVRATIERKLGFGAGGIAASQEKALPASVEAMRDAILDQLTYAIGKAPEVASPRDWFMATALATRRRVVDRWQIPPGRLTPRARSASIICRSSF